jgi:hypothetical protein
MSDNPRWSVDSRANEAADCILEAQEEFRAYGHYISAVAELPLLLGRHGLGQTLAYLQLRGAGRETSPYDFVYQQVARRLIQLFPVGETDLLTFVTRCNSRQYLLLAEEARLFAAALYEAAEDEADALEYDGEVEP